jgi:anti-sigma factor RsiW
MDYLDGELAQAERQIFEEHMGECPACVAYLESYAMTVKLTHAERESKPNEPPEDLIRAILAASRNP